MEQILSKEQVNTISKSIMLDITKKVDDLFYAKIESLSKECAEFVEKKIVVFEEMKTLATKINGLQKKYNEKYNILDIPYISRWKYQMRECGIFDIEEVRKSLIDNFIYVNNLNDNHRAMFCGDVVLPRIKAILCTLTSIDYEGIVKIVNDKLALNDLFDNRQEYLN